MFKIQCVSDMHGLLPEGIDCDLLLIAGDICPNWNHKLFFQDIWLRTDFVDWLDRQKYERAILVAGNHDFLFEKYNRAYDTLLEQHRCTYLQDSQTTFNSLNVYGTPWQPRFFDWAFNEDEKNLAKIWLTIPEGCDILVLHGPPHLHGDFSTFGNEHTGSPSLLARIKEVKPRLVVCGHIHNAVGRYEIEHEDGSKTIVLNVACVDENYELRSNPITTFEWNN